MRKEEKKAIRETWIQFVREAKKERSNPCTEPLSNDGVIKFDYSSILSKERGYENDKEN